MQDQMIPLREAAARYVSPDNVEAGYAILDAGVQRLRHRIMLIAAVIVSAFVVGAVLAQNATERVTFRGILLDIGAALIGLLAAWLFLQWSQHSKALGFLFPAEHPKVREFFDYLADGTITAYFGDPNDREG